MAGSVETGVDGDGLAFGERADGERLRGDAGGAGDRGGGALRSDAAARRFARRRTGSREAVPFESTRA